MDQRRQEREKIGLIGVMQVWGKSPPRSEELVLTVKLYFTEAPADHAPLPSQHYKFMVKNNPKASLMFALFKKKERLTLQGRGGHRLVSSECLHILDLTVLTIVLYNFTLTYGKALQKVNY
jgi:hypothetical protein